MLGGSGKGGRRGNVDSTNQGDMDNQEYKSRVVAKELNTQMRGDLYWIQHSPLRH